MDWQFRIGVGLAVVFGLLPYAVKDMPHWASWSGVALGILFAAWGMLPGHEKIPMVSAIWFLASVTSAVAALGWYYDNGPALTGAEQPQENANMQAVLQKLNELQRAVSAIENHKAAVFSQPASGSTAQLVLNQYEKLERASEDFSRFTGGRAAKEDLSSRLIADMNLVLKNANVEATPRGDALILRTGLNTFRVIFPVPMRTPPRVTFSGLPNGVSSNIVEDSDVGFTVIFTPQTIPVNVFNFNPRADSEL